ncbi:hypothetical protein FACS1894219_01020 [Clostridia bacterium]|nr:hypothetical protein FACS1894219_01020 [Clostridia bacterium]
MPQSGYGATGDRNIKITYDDVKVVLDGKLANIRDEEGKNIEPFFYNGTLFLPVRPLAKLFGASVSYDSKSRTEYITSGKGDVSNIFHTYDKSSYVPAVKVLELAEFKRTGDTGETISFTLNGKIDVKIDFDAELIYKNDLVYNIADKYDIVDGVIYIDSTLLGSVVNKIVTSDGGDIKLSPIKYTAHAWTDISDGLVAHAAGSIAVKYSDRTDYIIETNSFEAFRTSYANGYRVFEIDLNLTSDGKLAAVHDWTRYERVMSLSEYMKHKIKGVYSTMDLERILTMMNYCEDIFMITDTKSFEYTDEQIKVQFRELYNTAMKINPALLNRIIPQIYNQKMYALIRDIYKWNSIIYTLYQSHDSDDEVVKFVSSHSDIKVVAMAPVKFSDKFGADLTKAEKLVYCYTLNDTVEAAALRKRGVHGIYTDYIFPNN